MFRFQISFWCCLLASAIAVASDGTLIVHGGGNVSAEVRDRFLELAGGSQAKLLVIPTADTETPEDDGRLETWRTRKPASVALLHASSREQAEAEQFAEPLKRATGVWISGGKQSVLASTYLKTPVERELSELLKRGGVIAGTSAGAAIMSRVMIVRGEIREGFDLLPHGVVDQHFEARDRQTRLLKVLAAHPRRFGIGVDENTAAIVLGNRLSVIGESTVSIFATKRDQPPQRIVRLTAGEVFDLAALRE